MNRGTKRDTAKEMMLRKVRVKEKAKAKGKNNGGKGKVAGGLTKVSNGGLNRFVVAVHTVGNGATRKLDVISDKEDDRWNFDQWCHSLLFLTLDPLYRKAFKRRILLLFNLPGWSTASDVE